jgi:hypothetical protein
LTGFHLEQEKMARCSRRLEVWEVSWEQVLYVMTALKEVFGTEEFGIEEVDRASRALVMAAVGDMTVGGVVGTLEQEHSVLQEEGEGIEHMADMGHIVAEA